MIKHASGPTCLPIITSFLSVYAPCHRVSAEQLELFKAFRTGDKEQKIRLFAKIMEVLPTVPYDDTWMPSLPDPDPRVKPAKCVTEAEIISYLGEPIDRGENKATSVIVLDYTYRNNVHSTLRILIYQGCVYGRTIMLSI